VRKYLAQGLEAPCYGPRPLRPELLDPFKDYLRERVRAYPKLSAARLLRELRDLGYEGGYRPPVAIRQEQTMNTQRAA
jgi:transposase